MLLALWALRVSNWISCFPISIYSDSQAVLKAFRAQQAAPGIHLIEEMARLAETLNQAAGVSNHQHRIKLNWIAVHKDVKGNKRADEKAKRAASEIS